MSSGSSRTSAYCSGGEILWQKSEGSSGNCAWGSFMQPTNPSLRDITERVIVASKGRFDRALSAKAREARGLPHKTTTTADLYMQSTLDVWGHPHRQRQAGRSPGALSRRAPRTADPPLHVGR
jgi:hypothetical protein